MAFARLAALAAPLQPVIGKRRIALVISAPADRDGAGRTPSISECVEPTSSDTRTSPTKFQIAHSLQPFDTPTTPCRNHLSTRNY